MMLSIAKQYHAKAAAEARDSPEGPKPKLGFMPGHSKVHLGPLTFSNNGAFCFVFVCIHAFRLEEGNVTHWPLP